jgi:hypothetical protein
VAAFQLQSLCAEHTAQPSSTVRKLGSEMKTSQVRSRHHVQVFLIADQCQLCRSGILSPWT